MKRFAFFTGMDYYPNGGWDDFVSSYDTLEEAKSQFVEMLGIVGSQNWGHVVDLTIGEIVWSSEQ